LPVETIPDCGCDACDSGSRDLLEQLDQSILSIVDGSYEALISPDGRREPALEWTHALDEDAEEPGTRLPPSPHHGGRASPPPPRRTLLVNSLVLAIVGVGMMIAGYLLYSRYLSKKVYRLDAGFRTPAHELQDGVDYVPTN